jgi:hypothetical protein
MFGTGFVRLAIAALALSVAGSGAARAMVGAEARLWQPEADTRIKSDSRLLDGTKLSFEDDLDMDSKDDLPMLKVWLGGQQRISFTMYNLHLSGEDFPDFAFNFGGKTYTTAAEVDTDLKARFYRVAWESDWWSTDLFRLGTIAGTEIFDVDVSVKNDLVGSKSFDAVVPLPILGLQGEVGLPLSLAIYGEVAGIYVGYGDFRGGFIEWEAGLKLKMLSGHLYAMAGYREMRDNIENDDDRADLDLKGLCFGLGIKF